MNNNIEHPPTSINELVAVVAIIFVVIWSIIMITLKIKNDE